MSRVTQADPAARGARVGTGAGSSSDPQTRLELAMERFNASPEARTVAGLIRTLGPPWVSVGSAAGSATEVRITVAWDLGWYQWGVDPSAQRTAVRPISKGTELSQLDAGARQWNASAAEGGKVRLRAGRR